MRLGLLLLVVFGLLAAFAHRSVDTRRKAFPRDIDVLYLPASEQLRVMSLGYREALADLVWTRALVFAGENFGQTDPQALRRYVDAITSLAPRFRRPYLWGGVTSIYGGGTITRAMVDQSIDIYQAGLIHFPRSHQILYPLGMMMTHQVASTSGYSQAEKKTLAQQGVEYIRQAAAYGADPLVRRYAATLISEHATEQLAISFLESQLVEAQDEAHRRLLRRKLDALAGRGAVEEIEQIRRRFVTEHQAAAAYLPDTVWAVVRPDPSPLTSGPTRP